jgi:hypothetical protein
MRTIFIVLAVATAGCSAPKLGKVAVIPQPNAVIPEDLTQRVRYPELVAAYHVGRYVDPNHTLLMHEAHTVFRVEAQPFWNLHSPPGCFVLPSGTGALTNAAFALPAINDAVIAELNRQRLLTRTVTQQAESLNGSLHDFIAALTNTRTLAEQNHEMREQIVRDEHRLDALETELKKQKDQPTPEQRGDQ